MTIKEKVLDKNAMMVLDALTDGVIITDKDGMIEYINNAYALFHGITKEDFLNRHISEVRPTSSLPQVLRDHVPIMDSPRYAAGVESYCDFLPLFKEGKLVGSMAIVKDSMRIKGLLNKLEESNKKISQLDQRIKKAFRAQYTVNNIIGSNLGLKRVMNLCAKAAQTDSPVLLVGESGTGKELIAQSIHNKSDRRDFPFVDINCAALPEHLLESELFGYVEGAFTGAKKQGKLGLFEIASGGTIFLDEVSEMPINLQTKLLRAIQEKKIRKIGDDTTKKIDVRVISATNRDLESMARSKEFRDDLYFRLAVFVINVPPLRQRKSDIPLLVSHFISELQRKNKKVISISNNALEVFNNYDWPGNIRELQNALEYAFNITENNEIDIKDLPQRIIKTGILENSVSKNTIGLTLEMAMEEVEKRVLQEYIKLYGESVEAKKKIANELAISIATLYNKLRKYSML